MPVLLHRFLDLYAKAQQDEEVFDLESVLWAQRKDWDLPFIEKRNLQAVMKDNSVCLIDSKGFGDLGK